MLRVPGFRRHVALVFALLAASDRTPAGSIPRQDRGWKMYLNRATGFCVSYPSRWMKSETYDGSGLAIATGVKRHSPIPVGSMDVSALALPGTQIRSATLTLEDDFDLQLAGLKRFARAEQVEILERRTFTLGMTPSLFVKIRYLDPRDRKFWIDEVIFARHERLSYRLELETRADQLQRFETNFTQFVNSFQMECGSRTSSAATSNLAAFRLTR
ncbi:MAG: hypothetical protein ACJ74Y_09830 [Bryobacteraceae bacterium]